MARRFCRFSGRTITFLCCPAKSASLRRLIGLAILERQDPSSRLAAGTWSKTAQQRAALRERFSPLAPRAPQRRPPPRMTLIREGRATHGETAGYGAWADARGRAGARFSDLPEEARRRLRQRLTANATAPSRTAPKLSFDEPMWAALGVSSPANGRQ